jgi:uncharacterized protein YdaU (DUF1376 family)
MSFRPPDVRRGGPLAGGQTGMLRGLLRFDKLGVVDTEMLKRGQPGADVTQEQQQAANAIRYHVDMGGVELSITQDGVYQMYRVPKYFNATTNVPAAARTLGFVLEQSMWRLRNRLPNQLPASLLLAFSVQQETQRQRSQEEERARNAAAAAEHQRHQEQERARNAAAEAERQRAARTILGHVQARSVTLTLDGGLYKLRRVRFDQTKNVPLAARLLGFSFDQPNQAWVLRDPTRLPESLHEAFRRAQEEAQQRMEQEAARRADEERRRVEQEAARQAEREARRAEEEARRAEEERVRSVRARLKRLFDDVTSGQTPESAFESLSEEEMAIIREFKIERARRREAELEAMIRAIEAGIVPANAISDLNEEERTFVRSLAIQSAMSRSKASSIARVSEIKFADASLVDIYYKFMQVIANGFKRLETNLREAHETKFTPGTPFTSVKDSHSRGLNTLGLDLFGTWAFGHYGLYIRITASSPTIIWSLTVSKGRLNEKTGRAIDTTQTKVIESEMIDKYKYQSAIVRNSGTLIIALSALWNVASPETRDKVIRAEVDMSPLVRFRDIEP